MDVDQIRAVIESARARETGSLARLVRRRRPAASAEEVEEAAHRAADIIEGIPELLARASTEARRRNMVMLAEPLLAHAEGYFLNPVDLIPEMTSGMAGLVDDAYLTLRILQLLDRGDEPLVDEDLGPPVDFLRELLGSPTSGRLDAIGLGVVRGVGDDLGEVWRQLSHEA